MNINDIIKETSRENCVQKMLEDLDQAVLFCEQWFTRWQIARREGWLNSAEEIKIKRRFKDTLGYDVDDLDKFSVIFPFELAIKLGYKKTLHWEKLLRSWEEDVEKYFLETPNATVQEFEKWAEEFVNEVRREKGKKKRRKKAQEESVIQMLMKRIHELEQENQALREKLSKLEKNVTVDGKNWK